MRYIKNIIITLILLFSVSSVFSATLSTSTSLDVLYVNVFHDGKWSGWNNHADIVKGDKVWFQIHSYANGGDISGLVSKLENINGKTYLKDSIREISGFIDASNATKITDSVRLTFKENIKLDYAGYKWATKLKGPNPEDDEHVKSLPFGQDGKTTLTTNGVKLGDLAKDHRSNLLLFFSTGGYKPPINGKCSQQKNKCINGIFSDVKDDSQYYKWRCSGTYGGNNENCFLEKTPKDAVCSNYINKCKVGYFTDIKNDSKNYIWKCNGLNGGESLECKVKKKPINGVCGKSLNKCSHGSFLDVKDTYEKKLWTCKGLFGGQDTSCSIQKMCPCTLNKEVADTDLTSNNSADNCHGTNIDSMELLDENKYLKSEIKKFNNLQKNNSNNDNWKSWYWILGIIYTLIVSAITALLARRKR